MKDRPILFNGEMVRAILDGRKMQTRRVIRSPGNSKHIDRLLGEWGLSAPPYQYDGSAWMPGEQLPWNWTGSKPPKIGDWIWELQCDVDDHETTPIRCPYGAPRDHLWVRETWSYITLSEGEYTGAPDQRRRSKDNVPVAMLYRADAERDGWEREAPWSPSIFMPRWASRITLEVTDVRVERVQEIAPADCEAEGITCETKATPANGLPYYECRNGDGLIYGDARSAFAGRWDSINAKRGYDWRTNPWVWVVTFERVERDQ